MLYGCETWPAYSETIRRLTSADNGMVRWISGVRLEQRIRNQELHEKLDIISVTEEIRSRRFRYTGHLRRMNKNVWPRKVNDYVVPGILPRGRPNTGRVARAIMPRKNNSKEYHPLEVDKHYRRWVRLSTRNNDLQSFEYFTRILLFENYVCHFLRNL